MVPRATLACPRFQASGSPTYRRPKNPVSAGIFFRCSAGSDAAGANATDHSPAREDFSKLTRLRSNDELVADVCDRGLVKLKEKGDTHVVAFYANGVRTVPVILPVSDQNGPKYPKSATRTKVDELIVGKLRKLGEI